jgi:hypothetical protein
VSWQLFGLPNEVVDFKMHLVISKMSSCFVNLRETPSGLICNEQRNFGQIPKTISAFLYRLCKLYITINKFWDQIAHSDYMYKSDIQ